MRAVKSVLSASGRIKRESREPDEMVVLIKAIRDMNLPKFIAEDVILFDSKRKVEDFLELKRDSLIHKFYYGKPRQILKETIYNNFLIQR